MNPTKRATAGAYEQVVENVYPGDVVLGVVHEREDGVHFYSPYWAPLLVTKRWDNDYTTVLTGLTQTGEETSCGGQPHGTRVLRLSVTSAVSHVQVFVDQVVEAKP